jgi:hypothetical protein
VAGREEAVEASRRRREVPRHGCSPRRERAVAGRCFLWSGRDGSWTRGCAAAAHARVERMGGPVRPWTDWTRARAWSCMWRTRWPRVALSLPLSTPITQNASSWQRCWKKIRCSRTAKLHPCSPASNSCRVDTQTSDAQQAPGSPAEIDQAPLGSIL